MIYTNIIVKIYNQINISQDVEKLHRAERQSFVVWKFFCSVTTSGKIAEIRQNKKENDYSPEQSFPLTFIPNENSQLLITTILQQS